MPSIFWDLETSDLNFCAQILNYAFVCVDDDFNEIKRLTGKVRLSRTQLPSPMAVYVNRVVVGEHQNDPECEKEPDAMIKIRDWVSDIAERSPTIVPLIGFNSTKFDLNFLRTSMIRCGVSPYWGSGVMVYKDVLHVVQKLATINKDFLALIMDVEGKPNFKLANITKQLDVLVGEQTHESLDDVLLTIELTKKLLRCYDIDARSYNSYEPIHDKETVAFKWFPRFTDDSDGRFVFENKQTPMILLDSNYGYSLWVDLDRYAAGEGRKSIYWFNRKTSPFFVKSQDPLSSLVGMEELAYKAREEFRGKVGINNFWGEILCDIEQHIYAMPIKGIDCLNAAIWYSNLEPLKQLNSSYAWSIFMRYLCAQSAEISSPKVQSYFESYCVLRYGGEMVVSKMGDKKHATIDELYAMIDELPETCDEDTKIKVSLKEFYDNSEVVATLRRLANVDS